MARARSKETYSTHDVAKICCVTPTTVIRWIEDGLIPAFKTVGGHRRVRREDLERVCRERGIPLNEPAGTEVGRILVVDDEPVVLDLVRDVLTELSHEFQVEVAKDAFDAGRLVVAFRPQLIFLDLMMPGVDGFEVCMRLKKDALTKDTEVLGITGYYTEANTERILAAGAAGCLRKPLDVLEVRRNVAEAFGLKDIQVPSPAPVAVGRVLLITRNADLRVKVKEELAEAGPAVELLTAQTADDAQLVAQAAPPRHVIVSLNVPGIHESRLIETLVAGGQTELIAVHDAPDSEIRAAARKAGARMCLPTAALTGSVRELLGV